jgi:hypothetical protein
MPMQFPVTGLNMNFNMPVPILTINPQMGKQKIRTCIGIVIPGMNNLHTFPIPTDQPKLTKQPESPDKM